jgi:hypothetical protein
MGPSSPFHGLEALAKIGGSGAPIPATDTPEEVNAIGDQRVTSPKDLHGAVSYANLTHVAMTVT